MQTFKDSMDIAKQKNIVNITGISDSVNNLNLAA
jgi:hypothetical protein